MKRAGGTTCQEIETSEVTGDDDVKSIYITVSSDMELKVIHQH